MTISDFRSWPHPPTFLGIGAEKTGSTSLHYYLGQHPDVFVPPVKEPGYFALDDRPIVTDFEAYRRLFDTAGTRRARGEVSARYFHSVQAPSLIHCALPDVRLVGFIRNPVDRAYSHFLMLMTGREEIGNTRFEDAVRSRIELDWRDSGDLITEFCLFRSLYAENVERYLALFGPDRLRFYRFEQFEREPVNVMQDIFAFIGVDASFTPDLGRRHNVSAGVPHLRSIRHLILRDSGAKRWLRRLIPDGVRVPARRLFMQGTRPPKESLPPDLRARLAEKYVHDIERVERLLTLDLSSWKPA